MLTRSEREKRGRVLRSGSGRRRHEADIGRHLLVSMASEPIHAIGLAAHERLMLPGAALCAPPNYGDRLTEVYNQTNVKLMAKLGVPILKAGLWSELHAYSR